jgi:uncharacterized membrane protein
MDDRIRVSDADRDRVTARLREHFAEGRLTQDELDERISAALNAKTFGDLRPVMADLPEPAPVPSRAGAPRPWAGPPHTWGGPYWVARRRGPRLLPLVLLVLLAALVFPGSGWLLFGFFKLLLVFWLVTCLAGAIAAGLAHRRMHHYSQRGYTQHRHR